MHFLVLWDLWAFDVFYSGRPLPGWLGGLPLGAFIKCEFMIEDLLVMRNPLSAQIAVWLWRMWKAYFESV